MYKGKNYVGAKDTFLIVENTAPGYKATKKYMKKIDSALEKEARETARMKEKEKRKSERAATEEEKRIDREVDKMYREAAGLYKNKEYLRARDMFSSVERLRPGYKNVNGFMAKIQKVSKRKSLIDKDQYVTKDSVDKISQSEKTKKDRIKTQKEAKRDLNELRNEGLSFYRANRLQAAEDRFKKYERKLNKSDLPDSYRSKKKIQLFKDLAKVQKKKAKLKLNEKSLGSSKDRAISKIKQR